MKKKQCEVFGERLAELRQKRGLTQSELAIKLDIQRVTIAKYETGQRAPSIDHLILFSECFHVSADYLLGLSPNTTDDIDVLAIYNDIGLSETTIRQLKYIKAAGYIEILSELLNSHNITAMLKNINNVFIEANAFFDDTEVVTDVFNEFINDMSTNEFMKIALYDEKEIRNHINTSCYLKFEDRTDFYNYKCEKALKETLETLGLRLFNKGINEVTDKIYSMYVKHCEEASDNGQT